MVRWMKRAGYTTCTFPIILRIDPSNISNATLSQLTQVPADESQRTGIFGVKVPSWSTSQLQAALLHAS